MFTFLFIFIFIHFSTRVGHVFLASCILSLFSWPYSWPILSNQAPCMPAKMKQYLPAQKKRQAQVFYNYPSYYKPPILLPLHDANHNRISTSTSSPMLYTMIRLPEAVMSRFVERFLKLHTLLY